MLRGLHGQLLDYGCGYGDLAFGLSRDFDVRGVDVDPDRVAFARSEYTPVSFDVCSQDGLAFADESFDIVLSIVVIHFTRQPLTHLREARRVLRPGGHLLLCLKDRGHVRNILRRLLGRPPTRSALWIVSCQEMLDLLSTEGFEVVAQSYFYDPPDAALKSAAELVVAAIEQALSLLQVQRTAPYQLILARKL